MKLHSTITAIDYVGSNPKTIQLHAKFVIPNSESPIVPITLEFFEQQKSVQIVARILNNESIAFELWDATNSFRKAGILTAGGTLVSGGKAINFVTGQQPYVAEYTDYTDEILQVTTTAPTN